METILNSAMLLVMGVAVGVQWGMAPAVASVCATYLLMPYHYSVYKR